MDPILFAQLDPAQVAQGITQQGLAYIFALSMGLALGAIGYLFRALLAEKDKRIEGEKLHGADVATLLKGQVEMSDKQGEVMEKVYGALEHYSRQTGGPTNADRTTRPRGD